MAYEYTSVTPGIFSFTIPGENKTVKLFTGDKIIVKKQLTGTYLKMFIFNGEVPDGDELKTNKTNPKAKVADKITSVVETEDIQSNDNIDIEISDAIKEVEDKPTPKRRGRKKKVS